MNKRIEYIDALRGFTMILVVFAHIESFALNIEGETTLLSSIFLSFRMPLFFFISGFFAYKATAAITDSRSLATNTIKKLRIQLIPTLAFGLTYVYLVQQKGFVDFVEHQSKFGYWFTLVLLQMFIVTYIISWATRKQRNNGRYTLWIVLHLATAAIAFLALYPMKKVDALVYWGDLTSLTKTCKYFHFFVAGILASRYKEKLFSLLDNQYFTASIIITFIVLIYTSFTYSGDNALANIFIEMVAPVLLGYTGVLIVFNFFRTYQESFSKERRAGKALQYIGKHTLDIYLIHFFIIPQLPSVGEFIRETPNFVVELAIVVSLSLLVTGCCLIISKILRTSKFLGYYLFAAKK